MKHRARDVAAHLVPPRRSLPAMITLLAAIALVGGILGIENGFAGGIVVVSVAMAVLLRSGAKHLPGSFADGLVPREQRPTWPTGVQEEYDVVWRSGALPGASGRRPGGPPHGGGSDGRTSTQRGQGEPRAENRRSPDRRAPRGTAAKRSPSVGRQAKSSALALAVALRLHRDGAT